MCVLHWTTTYFKENRWTNIHVCLDRLIDCEEIIGQIRPPVKTWKKHVRKFHFTSQGWNSPCQCVLQKRKHPSTGMQVRWCFWIYPHVRTCLLLSTTSQSNPPPPPPAALCFPFGRQRHACTHRNDDSCFPSWLNATAVSINIFLSGPAGCLVWQGMHLTQPASSGPAHHLMWFMQFTLWISEKIDNIVNESKTSCCEKIRHFVFLSYRREWMWSRVAHKQGC